MVGNGKEGASFDDDPHEQRLTEALTPSGFCVPRVDDLLKGTQWARDLRRGFKNVFQPYARAGSAAAAYAFQEGADPEVFLRVIGQPLLGSPGGLAVEELYESFETDSAMLLYGRGIALLTAIHAANAVSDATDPLVVQWRRDNKDFDTTSYQLPLSHTQGQSLIKPQVVIVQYTQKRNANGALATPQKITFSTSPDERGMSAFTDVSWDRGRYPGQIGIISLQGTVDNVGKVTEIEKDPDMLAAGAFGLLLHRSLEAKQQGH